MGKYFALNKKIPCIASCGHIECLRKDLILKGYNVISLEPISEKRYNQLLKKITSYNHSKLSITWFD